MKTVMNQSHDGWLLKMISRTDPVTNKVVPFQRKHSTWNKTTQMFKEYNYKVYGK